MVDSLTIIIKEAPGVVRFAPYEGALKSHLVKRIQEMLKHYEPVLRLAPNVDDYLEFKLALEGKEEAIEPWEEEKDK
jgi:hypothetical protein